MSYAPRRSTSRWWLAPAGLLALLVITVASQLVYKAAYVGGNALALIPPCRRLYAAAQNPATLLTEENLRGITDDVGTVHARLSAIRRTVDRELGLLARLRWIPRLGPNLAALPHLADMGVDLVAVGHASLEGTLPLLDALGGASLSSAQDALPLALRSIQAQRDRWATAYHAANRVAEARAEIEARDLHPRLGQLLDLLDKGLPWLQAGTAGALLAPDLAGMSGARHYLVLAQNNDELRPTGGYISGIGLLSLDQGRIAGLSLDDSYAVDDLSVDHPDPPPAMREHMGIQLWFARDANWYPHFPSSAQACIELYYIDQGIVADGVIAADMTALQRMVALLGPLKLPSRDEVVNGDNLLETIQGYWAPTLPEGMTWEQWEAIPWEVRKATWFDSRKDFMPELVAALQARIFDVGSLDVQGLFWAVNAILDEKHALVYLADPLAQEAVEALGWTGSMPEVEGDFLAVVDTNVGYTKVNPNIEQRIIYEVAIDQAGAGHAQLDIEYTNASQRKLDACVKDMSYEPTYELMQQRCYWDYARVYVPSGASMAEATAPWTETPVEETDHTIWAGSLLLAPGESTSLSYRYDVGGVASRDGRLWTYRLHVEKQAGTNAIPIEITVVLPEGVEVKRITPAASQAEGNRIEFKTKLLQDQEIEIVYAP